MNNQLLVFIIGLAGGVLGGFFGVAGGVIIVPALIFLLGMPTRIAVGTSLGALLPPVGILGALVYYRQSDVAQAVADGGVAMDAVSDPRGEQGIKTVDTTIRVLTRKTEPFGGPVRWVASPFHRPSRAVCR